MSILENNERALKQMNEVFYEKYITVKQNTCTDCVIEELQNGEKIICRIVEDYEWRLNSAYDPERAAELYAKGYGKHRDYAVLGIFGISDGRVVRKLLKNCNETQVVVVYEPDAEVFLAAMEYFPLEKILLHERLVLVVEGINEGDLEIFLGQILNQWNYRMLECCILPNYDRLYEGKSKDFLETIYYHMKTVVFDRNTDAFFAKTMLENLLRNLPHILRQSAVSQLEKRFAVVDLKEIPAIVVSAGPSLDQNIEELKKAEGKAFIIGVDSALKALSRTGIKVQLAVTIDPGKPAALFDDERIWDFPYLLYASSIPLIAQRARKRLFFSADPASNSFCKIFLRLTGKDMGVMPTGGSVATNAFSLAVRLGFRNLILVGQDLAFTDGRGHVSGFEVSEEKNREHAQRGSRVEVEAKGGGRVFTDIQMDLYRQWFERQIEAGKDEFTVYNATAGGARIRGTVETTLTEAIEKLCGQEMDFDRMIEEIPPLFDEEERRKVQEEISSVKERLADLEKRLEEAIASYDRLLELESAGEQDTPEYQERLKEVYDANHMEEAEVYLELLSGSVEEKGTVIVDDIYEKQEMSVEEILQKGKALLKEYVEGIHICSEKIEEILLPNLPPLTS